jgi:antitoxin CptB
VETRHDTENRIHWRCRRGMLELDLVLERFLQEQMPLLGPEDLQAFDRLLDLEDSDLWDLILEKTQSEDSRQKTVLNLLRKA